MKSGSRIYLDYAATTPMDPRVLRAMKPYFEADFGNPGSLHSFGQAAIGAVDQAREGIAKAIGADFREIVFAGSASEANNLILRGLGSKIKNPRVVVSTVEHDSILETAKDLEKRGVEVVYLSVNREGMVDLKNLKEALNERTVLVSIMYANNEMGSIQPISKIANVIDNYRKTHNSQYPFFHADAVQAMQFLDCNVANLGVDLMTFSAHKIYGPKGVGSLYARDKVRQELAPLITGGGQEFGLRSGTENVAGIVGFAEAVRLAIENKAKRFSEMRKLSNYFFSGLKRVYSRAEKNGSREDNSLPNILNIYFPGFKAEELAVALDLKGVAVSAGSACSARSSAPSHVISAMFGSSERAKASLRFSFGEGIGRTQLDKALMALAKVLKVK